ncbi:glycerate kinase [Rudanella lutea]|uniref:glycerate kinase n=1 Tax=Rudanella lutea TaxID=451374 RepID=UPI0003678E13|nr:glycerate kinase [Rudanella lutea]
MRILIAPDKFKGSLTAVEVAQRIEHTLLDAEPEWHVKTLPVADGGEGTAAVLTQATDGHTVTLTVNDPLFRPVEATYGISGDGRTAFIEMAQASGLQHLKAHERNPLETSTFGTGELIRDAIARGVSEVLLCIGGSATNDGGIGMASALGYVFLDRDYRSLPAIGKSLRHITALKRAVLDVPLSKVTFRVACDVANPLYGHQGAAYVYGPQKGASPDDVAELDLGLRRLAAVLLRDFDIDEADLPGSGAAGGLGFGARVFLKARLEPGFDMVASYLNIESELDNTDLVITGEGSLDEQTLNGKVIGSLVRMAQTRNIPVVAFCGQLALPAQRVRQLGLHEAIAITPSGMPLPEAMQQAPYLLEKAVGDWVRERTYLLT